MSKHIKYFHQMIFDKRDNVQFSVAMSGIAGKIDLSTECNPRDWTNLSADFF